MALQVGGGCSHVCACAAYASETPGRWQWYDKYFAYSMAFGMQSYEEELAACKRGLFAELFRSPIHSLLEVGLGTGPNLKFYSEQKVKHTT